MPPVQPKDRGQGAPTAPQQNTNPPWWWMTPPPWWFMPPPWWQAQMVPTRRVEQTSQRPQRRDNPQYSAAWQEPGHWSDNPPRNHMRRSRQSNFAPRQGYDSQYDQDHQPHSVHWRESNSASRRRNRRPSFAERDQSAEYQYGRQHRPPPQQRRENTWSQYYSEEDQTQSIVMINRTDLLLSEGEKTRGHNDLETLQSKLTTITRFWLRQMRMNTKGQNTFQRSIGTQRNNQDRIRTDNIVNNHLSNWLNLTPTPVEATFYLVE